MFVCDTMECVIDMFLVGKDATLGGARHVRLYTKDGDLFLSDRLLATRYEEYVALHPLDFIPGNMIASLYGKVVSRAIGRTALVHTETYACVPRVRIYMSARKLVDLSLTWPVLVYPRERRVEGLELCPEILELNHILTAWGLGNVSTADAVRAAQAIGYDIGLLRGDFDGSLVLERLNVEGDLATSFYLCDPRGDVWAGVVLRWVKCGLTSMMAGCAEVVRPFEGLDVPGDVASLLRKMKGNPSAAQLVDDVIR